MLGWILALAVGILAGTVAEEPLASGSVHDVPIAPGGIAPFGPCPGDCNGDTIVTVDELVRGVEVALGRIVAVECSALDIDGSATVTINELILAVGSALNGCPLNPTITPTPRVDSPGPSATPTATPDQILAAIEPTFRNLCGVADYTELHPTDTGYYGYCSPNGSDDTAVTVDRFDDIEIATDAFAQASGVGPPIEFAGLPAVFFERGFTSPSSVGTRTMVWQVGCWVIAVHSYYAASGGRPALQPQVVSQAILDTAGTALINQCPKDAATPTPTKGIGPDLVVSGVDAYAVNDTCQPFAVLDLCVANAGRTADGEFMVTVEPGGDRFSLPGLAAGAEECADRRYPSDHSFSLLVTIAADVDNGVDEIDESNNVLSERVLYPRVEATCVPTRARTATPGASG